MIASIRGVITSKSPAALIVEVSGIGYQIYVPLGTFYRLPEETEIVSLQIYTHVREDAIQLYGFLTSLEKTLFLLLISISGVGPKLALNILSGMEGTELVAALRDGDTQRLRGIPGVGPKTAGRLVLELKAKVASLSLSGTPLPSPIASPEDQVKEDAFSALINLGYNRNDAKKALDAIVPSVGSNIDSLSVESLIKQSLKRLAKIG